MIPTPELDLGNLVSARANRLRETMRTNSIDVCLLTNPVSIRYATDYRGYAMFQSHIPTSAVVIAAEGPTVLMGANPDRHSFLDQVVPALPLTGFDGGLDTSQIANRLASYVAVFINEHGLPKDATIGIERTTPVGFAAFAEAGLRIVDAEATVELARSRKHPLELEPMLHSIDVAQFAMTNMHEALKAGITENQLWSILHQVNIAHNGEWIEGRMLASGPRSNPWLQEATGRVINDGELVAFDTDMIGPFGYCADISRTFLCGDGEPNARQRSLYQTALDELEHNTALLKVGASFAELSHSVLRHSSDIVANRYPCAFHGVGMSDEYPKIPYPDDWEAYGYDGGLEEDTMICVESYVGPAGASEGVKLEQMVQITSDGVKPLSTYPFWVT
jgi:Xaa-Pro dipeptidase